MNVSQALYNSPVLIQRLLTPNACALVGDIVLQFGPEARLPSSASNAPIVHQQESLVVVVQAAGVPGRVLDIVLSRKAALYYIQGYKSRETDCEVE